MTEIENGKKRRCLEQVVGKQFTTGNRVTVLRNGQEIFPAMLEAIGQAEESVDFLTFVYWKGEVADQFADALAEAEQRGVRVRVLLDSYGAAPMEEKLVEKMKAAGVDVRWFRPFSTWKVWSMDNRTHRKLLVCDRATGFTGGVGIAEEWMGDARGPAEWRDNHYRLEGPCVAGLSGAFYENWSEAGHVINRDDMEDIARELPERAPEGEHEAAILTMASSASPGWTDFAMLVQAILALVDERIDIATPYFAPDEALEAALREAVGRRVRVRILISGKHTDQRFQRFAAEEAFERMLEVGVSVAYYHPTMLHQKLLLMDDGIVLAGSSNINQRSMLKDDEFNFIAQSTSLVRELDTHFAEDWERGEPVTMENWQRRSWWQRIGEKLVRQFKPEL